MIGYTYTLRSDGVTINTNPMLPGSVYDGDVTGYDLTVLPSRTNVTVNWDSFGESRSATGVARVLTGSVYCFNALICHWQKFANFINGLTGSV